MCFSVVLTMKNGLMEKYEAMDVEGRERFNYKYENKSLWKFDARN